MARQRRTPEYSYEYSRQQHRALPLDAKLALGVPANIYDAAKSYRVASGQGGERVRDILKSAEFRQAWQDFRGKGRTWRERMRAADALGWDRERAKEVLHNISP